MSLLDLLLGRSDGGSGERALSKEWTDAGVSIRFKHPLPQASVEALNDLSDIAASHEVYLLAYLGSLVTEGLCDLDRVRILVPWETVYRLRSSEEHRGCIDLLSLPEERRLTPILDSEGSLADSHFVVRVVGWAEGSVEASVVGVRGAIATANAEDVLLPEAVWRLASEVEAFANRADDFRTQRENELAWGHLRSLASAANALYRTPYLETTFVLTPKTLRLPLSRQNTPFGSVVIVEPTFEGAPEGWIDKFDEFRSVQSHYDFAPANGPHVRVVLSEQVRQVLSIIKREMHGRRVAGARAEQFIRNPWAFLGEAAHEVLREKDFAEDKAGAGPTAAEFSLFAKCTDGRITGVFLDVREYFSDGSAVASSQEFTTPDALKPFVTALSIARREGRVQFKWEEYDLTIDGTSEDQQRAAESILAAWVRQPAQAISLEDIYELSGYSSRISGIGVAKSSYIPLIQAKGEDQGWVPEDLTPMVRVTLSESSGQVVIPLTREWVDEFSRKVDAAEATSAIQVVDQALPGAVSTAEARTLVDSFRAMLNAPSGIKLDGQGKDKGDASSRRKESLLIKTNFHRIDYLEERKKKLELPEDAAPVALPRSLRPSIQLREHQHYGVTWFGHLVRQAPAQCRGAVLADDMGLGKTIQLLAVLAKYYEERQSDRPSLILVPKSLLRNWEQEAQKFFDDSFPKVLALYDAELRDRRQPRSLIDQQLQEKGITDLLKPDWVGKARVIITTYEVLTYYEFSFAKVPFAFVICDEAQRIKTPGTLVSNAVRALKADFRIVCTGTPVENSLADLWCLFDFVQPGLLGGLSEFGGKYRRPIECDPGNIEQQQTVKELQDLISPQVLRRTKAELKQEFKKKYFAHRKVDQTELSFKESLDEGDRLEVPLSSHQNVLYLAGLKKLQDAAAESDSRRRMRGSFDALHLMKAVCAEPYCIPGKRFLPDKAGVKTHLANSTKLAEVLSQLRKIRLAGEKAILFTELREVQSCLYYFLHDQFGIKPSIINGDTEHRQKIIDRFSESEGFNAIILSTLAAGAGLNVTAANHVFHFTRAWNPAKENQATDRAYRIGQQKDVFVYCPVSVSQDYVTFDVRLDELLRKKARLANTTLGDSPLTEMLNGSGPDVSLMDLVVDSGQGKAFESRPLTMDDIDRLDGFGFEVLCKMLWEKSGYLAKVTPKKRGDGGIDVYAVMGKEGELLQCKSSKGADVGWDAIKEVVGGAAMLQRYFPGVEFRRVVVTNQNFNGRAREQAVVNGVRTVERADLEGMLLKWPIKNTELDADIEASGILFESEWTS